MSKAPSMPLFCGDYLKDTPDLSLEEHGAYLLLLMYTWSNGCRPLPDDDDRIARRLRITKERWQKKLRPVLAPLFDLADGSWRSPRLEKEWSYVQERIEAKRRAGALGGRPPKHDPDNGPENSPISGESVRRNMAEDQRANRMKNNKTTKANGFAPHNLQESSPSPSSAYAETFADAKGAGAPPPDNVVHMPLTAEGELFGPVLADLAAAVPDVVPREIRAVLGKAKGHFGPDAALALAKQSLLRAEPWSWLCGTINVRINSKSAAGGRPIEAGAKELLDKIAAMKAAMGWAP